ncbi:STAS domain-containing protein [Viridibacterium curvum]|uniref:STAS domain-containing protein n=1 Tax=Viridibacterium curvum TaxID=1101404 RepID=A0ABP9QLX5_9RHOO
MTSGTFSLSGPLSIYVVASLHAELTRQRDSTRRLTLDLGGVDEIDGAGWQLLLVHACDALQAGQPLQLTNVPACVQDVFATMGLADWLATVTVEGPQALKGLAT